MLEINCEHILTVKYELTTLTSMNSWPWQPASSTNSWPWQPRILMQQIAVWLVHTCFGRAYLCECVRLRWDCLHVRWYLRVYNLISINNKAWFFPKPFYLIKMSLSLYGGRYLACVELDLLHQLSVFFYLFAVFFKIVFLREESLNISICLQWPRKKVFTYYISIIKYNGFLIHLWV